MNHLTSNTQSEPNEPKIFMDACIQGQIDVVQALLIAPDQQTVFNIQHGWALQMAAQHGHIDIVKLLLEHCEPTINNSKALSAAASWGRLDVVKLLLPISDPQADNCSALIEAVLGASEHDENYSAYLEIIQLLLPQVDYHTALNTFEEEYWDNSILVQCIEEYEALQQQQRLLNHLDPLAKTEQLKRKM